MFVFVGAVPVDAATTDAEASEAAAAELALFGSSQKEQEKVSVLTCCWMADQLA